MIRYDLICANKHTFDGWFRDSAGFDEQVASAQVPCPVCGSGEIEKALMAPGVPAKSNRNPDPQKIASAIRALHQQVKANADYVGDNFAQEARRIHYKETEKRGIYGEATLQDARDLNEEGIGVLPLPRLPEEQN